MIIRGRSRLALAAGGFGVFLARGSNGRERAALLFV